MQLLANETVFENAETCWNLKLAIAGSFTPQEPTDATDQGSPPPCPLWITVKDLCDRYFCIGLTHTKPVIPNEPTEVVVIMTSFYRGGT